VMCGLCTTEAMQRISFKILNQGINGIIIYDDNLVNCHIK